MFSTCLFCHASLGANQIIEHFPVGRRLAFDADRGRLWAVCRKCERWNLTPLEERWEAIEECERAYRDSRKRVSTDNIALARLRDGTDVIRIGQPLRPEFAAWRYERVIQKRRWKMYGSLAVGIGAVAAINAPTIIASTLAMPVLGSISALVGVAGQLGHQFWLRHDLNWRRQLTIPLANGQCADLTRIQMHTAKCRLGDNGQLQLALSYGGRRQGIERLLADQQRVELVGDAAQSALRRIIVGVNHEGASPDDVRAAVTVVEAAMDESARTSEATPANPLGSFMQVLSEHEKRERSPAYHGLLGELYTRYRLALEMTLHEDDERRAMSGELGALYARWEEAERIAKIADGELTALAS